MPELGRRPPQVSLPLTGGISRSWIDRLAASECPALTTRRARRRERSGADHDPIVWQRATGANVVDVDGNVYVDLTSGFGAAAVGHAHPKIVGAIRAQADTLVHALGDLHPSDVKIRLLERLAQTAPWPKARVILGLNGGDAVEAALKTAMLATGRAGVLAFEGSYHGLGHGPLAACGYDAAFRAPFAAQLNPFVRFAPWPTPSDDAGEALDRVEREWRRSTASIGAILVEPIQGRAGARIPPPGFLAGLRALADSEGAVVIVDEIQTGLGRTGETWRSSSEGLAPDLVCTGKALGGGMPMSACLGRAEVMEAWGDPNGQALHTATFFGHPIGCAAALASLEVIEEESLAARAHTLGASLLERLRALAGRFDVLREARGAGLLIGLELDSGARALRLVHGLLEHGYLVLPAGTDAQVIQLLPPLMIPEELLEGFTDTLAHLLEREER